jgi:dihydroorotate dehydrogenase
MFLAPPETAHEIAKWFFKRPSFWRPLNWHLCVRDERLHVKVGNIELPNPVGLAAGFDKNCEMWNSLFRIGFGYLTLGTVTLNAREGNAKPRMWRYPERSLVNSMGLPNRGARENAANLVDRSPNMGPIIVSVSGLNIEEFVECYRQMEPLTDGIELNISTPNTIGVRIFQEPDMLTKLLKAINETKTPNKPIWVKIPPYFDDEGREKVHELIDICAKAAVNGLTASNTKLVNEPRASIGTGGLSGPPIFNDMIRIVADVHDYTEGRIPINACGGISSGFDAWKAFEAGASSVQLYTALVYHGPGVISRINRQILHLLTENKLDSLREVIGMNHN